MSKRRAVVVAPQRVVGVGASAGGLDALKLMLARVPADTGLAFIVLQHQPSARAGQLASSLATATELPVIDVATGHRIAPDTVLVVPPRTSASVVRGAVVLRAAKAGARPRRPIDGLFGSLAKVLGERAVGVVLSGAAHDGTEGLRAIQAAGGLTFAQEPSTAQLDEMPANAIAAGVAALVLPPAQIGAALGAFANSRSRDHGELWRVSRELDATQAHLRSVVTQHLATSQELGITNEQLQTTNEELQTTNEELHTAHEELETVNAELELGNVQLRDANDDLVNVLASVEIAIIIVDAERRVRRFTPTARAVMRLIPGDLGRPIADLQPSVAFPGLDQAIADVIATLAVAESEVRHADGTWYRMQIRPYRTVDGRINGAVIAFVDITALRAARDYATAIVETVSTPLVVVDHLLRVVSANRAFCGAFGATHADLIGRAMLELGEWRDPALPGRLAAVAATGLGFDGAEAEHRGPAGARVLRLGAHPLPPVDGRLILIGIADITEQRRLEQARDAAARERDGFLDGVSHELRAPLSAILLWAQALLDLELDDPLRRHAIETIRESAQSEAQLVDDLLELALSRTTELTVTLERVAPSAIVQAVIDRARCEADAKQIGIETALAAGPTIRADPRRLRQIASRLIGNAIKFTPPGGTVSVALAFARGAMELLVRDTGPGIPPEFIGHAFEPFSQADPSRTRAHGGLGIGLALVRHFVERHGGTVDVASPGAGRGTTFTVRIPSQDEARDAAPHLPT